MVTIFRYLRMYFSRKKSVITLWYNHIPKQLIDITDFFPPTSDCRGDGAEEVGNKNSTSPTGSQSPVMDRNPSPPPEVADGEEDEDLDAIGDTVYSKHWLFSTLTRLIHVGGPSLLLSHILSDVTQRLSVKSQLILNLSGKDAGVCPVQTGKMFLFAVSPSDL